MLQLSILERRTSLKYVLGVALLLSSVSCSNRPPAASSNSPISNHADEGSVRLEKRGASSAPSIAAVPLHLESQQDSVREATTSHQHPERLSLLAPVTPWNEKAYRAHPEQYLDVIEPGRALAPARPEPGIPRLVLIGSPQPVVPSLGTVTLSVQVSPRAPVTFTSLDRGLFENGLTSITVQADTAGLGTVHFTATAGTVADVRILAASPMTSGQGRWVIGITSEGHS